jgi:hypothetical protein
MRTTPGAIAHAVSPLSSRSRHAGACARASATVALAAAWLAGGCSDPAPAPGGPVPVRFIASNALASPVTIAVDGVPQVTLSSGQSTGMTVSSRARAVTWTSAKPTDAHGVQIPDDIGEIAIAVSSLRSTLDITNIIADDTYVTAEIFNVTSSAVSIGVYDGVAVACASALPAATPTRVGYTRTGYYRLRPTTEMRAYRDPTSCTGPYVAWPHALLAAFAPGSGDVILELDSAP